MNSKELTAEILETIKDLRWNNADQKMIFNAVKNLIDTNTVVNKNDLLPDVRQQSKLLKAFCSMLLNAGDLTQLISDDEINSFLKAFNCA